MKIRITKELPGIVEGAVISPDEDTITENGYTYSVKMLIEDGWAEVVDSRWMPSIGEVCYRISTNGMVYADPVEHNKTSALMAYDAGMCFELQEQAERLVKLLRLRRTGLSNDYESYDGNDFYYVDTCGEVCQHEYSQYDLIDVLLLTIGNFYPTRDLAKKHREEWKDFFHSIIDAH